MACLVISEMRIWIILIVYLHIKMLKLREFYVETLFLLFNSMSGTFKHQLGISLKLNFSENLDQYIF